MRASVKDGQTISNEVRHNDHDRMKLSIDTVAFIFVDLGDFTVGQRSWPSTYGSR
jgi:hypothetical protein